MNLLNEPAKLEQSAMTFAIQLRSATINCT